VTRDWTAKRWAAPAVIAALIAMRLRLPRSVGGSAHALHVEAVWIYHRVVTPALAQAAKAADLELYAWTVDDLPTMRRLVDAGVTGLVSNDPRLFEEFDGRAGVQLKDRAEFSD
jgi:glycerophosphoryl diester phosphodiesterase